MQPIGVKTQPADLFGFELTAEGARSVTATVAFDTDAGWFVASIPSTTLQAKERHYDSPSASFVKRNWISPIMYLKFPTAVNIAHSWVYSAQTIGDDFGWSKMGVVSCQPFAGARAPNPPLAPQVVRLDPKDVDDLSIPPGPGSTIVAVTKSKPLKQAHCATPFQDATATRTVRPEYPMMARRPAIDVTSTIQVAINADGSPADAWVFYPSGFPQFDDAAIQAARQSKYRAGIAYCEAVPGLYLLK